VRRTAEQPLTATDIAWKMMEAADIKNASKIDAQVVAQGILRSLLSHNGNGVQNVAEGETGEVAASRQLKQNLMGSENCKPTLETVLAMSLPPGALLTAASAPPG
jgi:precorrin isomerase